MSSRLALVLGFVLVCLQLVANVSAFIGTPSRLWFVGGNFSVAYNDEAKTDPVDAYYMAYWNGEKWNTLGSTDGPVRSIRMDLCQNLYVGGEFTKINDIPTGPLAVRRIDFNRTGYTISNVGTWEPVISTSWDEGAYVNAIGYSCLNTEVISTGSCKCDVYAGGLFSKVGDKDVNNIIKVSNGVLDDLSGGLDGEVRALYKSSKTLYAAGDHPQKFSWYSDGRWDHAEVDYFNGAINAIAVDAGFTYDDVYLAGEFTSPFMHVAVFHGNSKKFEAVGENIDGVVNDIGLKGSDVYIGGNFTQGAIKNVGMKEEGKTNFRSFTAADDAVVGGPIYAIDVCYTKFGISFGCTPGDTFVGGDSADGWVGAAFYSEETGEWKKIGGGVNGKILTVESAFTSSGSSVDFAAVKMIIFACASLAMLMLALVF
eukprot:GEZU01033034.1.p1 GENE.GEZU01033034.1~~GEZU01033034.1.p1  ORF type:complete len:426 (-),score=134.70 GEZU01033034.1:176-1453(-)